MDRFTKFSGLYFLLCGACFRIFLLECGGDYLGLISGCIMLRGKERIDGWKLFEGVEFSVAW